MGTLEYCETFPSEALTVEQENFARGSEVVSRQENHCSVEALKRIAEADAQAIAELYDEHGAR